MIIVVVNVITVTGVLVVIRTVIMLSDNSNLLVLGLIIEIIETNYNSSSNSNNNVIVITMTEVLVVIRIMVIIMI